MVSKLDNTNQDAAQQIFTVFQHAYQMEAQLIGVDDFPPLSRSVDNIIHSTTDFFGSSEKNELAAVIEIGVENKRLEIHSLTVDPAYFRRGLGGKLLRYVLEAFDVHDAIVETAAANKPAIALYQQYGFEAYKWWTPSHGIEKVAMQVNHIS